MWQTLFGIGLFGLVIVGVATYMQHRAQGNQPPPQHRYQRHSPECNSEANSPSYVRASKAGDICGVCLEQMGGNMERLKCNHGLHRQCFDIYIKLRAECPICFTPIRVTNVGDRCVICQNEINSIDNITYLGCGHAFDDKCLTINISNGNNSCPICRFPITNKLN